MELSEFFCGIVRAPLDVLSHKVWLLDETSLSLRIAWECWQFLDIYVCFGYPWISMDFHGFPWISIDYHGLPQISIDFLTNRKYPWIQEICKSMGNPKYFGYPWEIQIIIGFPISHTKCET